MRRSAVIASVILLIAIAVALGSRQPQPDQRMRNAFRRAEKNGWIFVHLEGNPAEIGYQHGVLLAPEIRDTFQVISKELMHDEAKPWSFFRDEAKALWEHTEEQYRQELQGIADGANSRGVKNDVWDIVAINAWLELPYYAKWYNKRKGLPPPPVSAPEHCSAFIATGSYTRDGRVVMGHNNWTSYQTGERWNVIFDIVPTSGHHFIMDGMASLIHSADDFGINDAGIMITETTISGFEGWDPAGKPEFVRARKAMQYAESIDDFARIMQDGNNGGYANDWLVADRKTNEVASLELGLKNVNLKRTKDGYFVGANFPIDDKLAREESTFDLNDPGLSPNARRVRWEQLMAENKGRIDVAAARRFLADHYNAYDKKTEASERTICGHVDESPRGVKGWQPPYGIAGAVQSKAADATMAEHMSLTAALGHSCGVSFKAAEHLRKYPEFSWQKETLRDMPARPWTTFVASR